MQFLQWLLRWLAYSGSSKTLIPSLASSEWGTCHGSLSTHSWVQAPDKISDHHCLLSSENVSSLHLLEIFPLPGVSSYQCLSLPPKASTFEQMPLWDRLPHPPFVAESLLSLGVCWPVTCHFVFQYFNK